ncbi:GlxA family transcriptional regulator [Celeribacter neptunius]|uniref:Transcriptional regulator GlxA family, contains an amidase domain and an AraC-type DNA-binding HTH domain n=1 Tax=Celeribacter neptunius TaxID=588602 RepID=A0A1I3TME5_9RHOB|nr:GlxA family transcriptional regulator [Celeribacter neptunius]SFJ70707.1 Transcriptional regulator GlxA family, contains an amidase domain and an AraC-type DNA-binding HTH domain [Celeribacter neptunius]
MRRIAFLLIDDFALLSTAAALEPLRAANVFAPEMPYDVTLLSHSGTTSTASLGARFDGRFYRDALPLYDMIFVVAGGNPARITDPALFSWLRQADRNGCALGGISGGAVILARAGLLQDRRFTVHWHHYDDFERLPGPWLLERKLFVIDRDRYTCAGGSAPLDMMHAIIARDHGTRFAGRISDWFIQTEVRGAEAPQRTSLHSRYGALPRAVEAALELMESHIADPLDQDQIATLSGLSTRQLQRQFREGLGHSVMEEYRRIRLETGKDLISSTRLSLAEIAQMTGFSSQAHFSDAFRKTHGIAPSELRKKRARREPDPSGTAKA